MRIQTLFAPVLAVALASCSASQSDTDLQTADQEKAVAGSGLSNVILDGAAYELETWPTGCGQTRNQKGFSIKAGPNDGDADPRNNALTLHIGGDRNAEPLVSIRFTPPREDAILESTTLKGADAPWIDGKRFSWSGTTSSGRPLSVEAECP